MAISSASERVFKAEDPVMNTDLELLAKVNTYEESKYDQGEKNLQNEVNNWSLLSQVAKPQDREYINGKLNKLVAGINNLGGVDLSDPNNVNQLKSLGYSLYGDDKVMNPVLTTRKMNALAQDITAKTNGKNAKDYDSVYGEYLMNSYQDWLNDGQQGSKFDGPTALPQGTFDQYSKKINDEISKLKPDMNEAPQDSKDAALNYYQVGDKFIKKDRIKALIDANTGEQDKNVLQAHAWKSMQGLPDNTILDLQKREYDTKIKDMQDNWNYLQHQQALTTDFKQKQLFQSQMDELHNDKGEGAIDVINKQKQYLPTLQEGQNLDKNTRQQLSNSLFYNAYKEDVSSAAAYDQKKVELKTNQAAIFNQKTAQENFWHGKDYDLKVKENKDNLDFKKEELAFKEESSFMKYYTLSNGGKGGFYGGPAGNAPLGLKSVKGDTDAVKLNNDSITQADANYTAASKNFYQQGYDYLMSKDPTLYGNFLKQDGDGNWIPKDADRSSKIVNQALDSFMSLYGNVANMSVKERAGLTFNADDDALFKASKDMEEAGLYKKQMADITGDVFRKAGKEDPETKNLTIRFNKGQNVNITYAKLKEMIDKKDPLLDEWKKNSNFTVSTGGGGGMYGDSGESSYNEVSNAIGAVNSYYDDSAVTKAWNDASATVNPYTRTVALPKTKTGKLPDEAAKILVDAIQDVNVKKDVKEDDIDLNKVWTVIDSKTLQPKYMGEIRYRKAQAGKDTKGDKGDKTTDVDLTSLVDQQLQGGGGWISSLYAQDNVAVVYGMALQSQGRTPFDPSNNFEGALQTRGNGLLTHKYQVVAVKDPTTKGITGYKVFVAIPLGKSDTGKPKFQVMPVPNFLQDASGKTLAFPANFEGVRAYMDTAFDSSEHANDFYSRLGIPYNQ